MSDYKVTTVEASPKAQKASESDDRMPSKAEQAKIIDLALKRFKRCSDDWSEQRRAEAVDLKFQVPELQWDDAARRAREGNQGSGQVAPARPCLSISKIDQPVQLVLNQERAAKLGVNVHPLGPDSDDETAEVEQGIYRQIERESHADGARSWAFDRAVKAGFGVYRVCQEYDDAGGHPFDQVIRIERLLYQDCVYLDMSAQKADFSDGKYAFVVEWVKRDDFEEQYPGREAEVSSAFSSMSQSTPEWINNEDDTILVAEYYYKEFEDVELVALKDGRAVEKDDMTDKDEIDLSIPKRKKRVPVLRWCKLTGASKTLLDYQECDGKYIPLIPVIGEELQPFDGKRRWQGLIRGAKDSQRVYNYAMSTAVELAALEPKAPFVMAEGQDEGFQAEWLQANNRNFPVLHYKAIGFQGNPLPPPQRMQVDGSRLSVSLQLMQQANDGIQATTQTFDPSLGNMSQTNRSGKSIEALQSQADAGNSHFMHNLADVSMRYEALVVLDLMRAIYDRKGRLVRTLDEEDEPDMVMLNQPHIEDPKSGQLIPVNGGPQGPGMPPGAPQMGPGGPMPPGMPPGNGGPPGPPQPPPEVKHYDLGKGAYGVSVSIGKSWQSRLEQGSEEIGQILQSQPNLMPLIGPLYFKFRDFPGAREIADLLKKVREKQFPGLDDDGGPQSPEALQAQLSAAHQQIQMLQGQLQQAGQMIQTKQVENQGRLQVQRVKSASDERLAQLEATVKLLVAKINADSKARDLGLMHGHEADQAQQAAAHELGMQAHAQAGAAAAAAAKPLIAPYTASDEMPLGSEEGV